MREGNDPEIPSLNQLGEFIRGRGGTKADARSSGVPCVRYGELYTTHHDVIRQFSSYVSHDSAKHYTPLRRGDVVFAGSGETLEEIGKAAAYCMDVAAVVGADTIVLRTNAHADAAYLGYAVNATAANRQKATLGHGSSVMHIGSRELGGVRLFVPPLPEQRQIAAILDTLDDAIRKTEQIIAKLKQVKQGLLHDLLTRGIDDNGDLRDPERHPEQFKESALGRIPKAWEIRQLGSLLDGIEQGWSPDCASTPATPGEWGVLKTTAVQWDGFFSDANKALPQQLTPRIDIEVSEGDVLMTRAGPASRVGVVAFVERTQPKLMLSDKLYRLVPKASLNPHFLTLGLSGQVSQQHLNSMKAGLAETQENISHSIVRALRFLQPPLEEQRRISGRVLASNQREISERRQLEKLRILKAGLMEDLLTGRVRVTPLLENASP